MPQCDLLEPRQPGKDSTAQDTMLYVGNRVASNTQLGSVRRLAFCRQFDISMSVLYLMTWCYHTLWRCSFAATFSGDWLLVLCSDLTLELARLTLELMPLLPTVNSCKPPSVLSPAAATAAML